MGNKIASPQKVNLEKAKEAFADMKNAATLNLSEDEFIKKLETDTSFAKTAYDKIFKATEHKTLDAQSADDFYKLMYEDSSPVNKLEEAVQQEAAQQEGNMPGMVMPEKPKKMFSSVASTIQNPLQKYQNPEDIVGPNYTFPLDVPKSEFESMEEKKAKQLPDAFVEKNPIHEMFGKDTVVGEGYYNNPVQELGQSPEKDLEIVDAALAELDKKIADQDKKYSGMLAELENKVKQDWTLGGGKNSVMTKKVNAENTMNDPAIQYIIQNKTALSLQKDLLETYRQYAVYDNSVQVGKQMQQMVDEGLLSQESFDYLRGVQYVDRQREAIERLAKYGKITEDTKNKLLSLGDLSNKDNIATGLLKTGKLKDFASLGLTEMTRNFDIKDIADRINEGKTVSTEERNVLAIYSKLANLTSSENERGFWFEAGQGLQTSLQFVLSAYLTGGVSAVGKLGTTSLLKHIGKNALRQAAFVPVTPMAYRDFSAMQLNDALNGEKNTLSNLYKAYAQTFGERFSETLGVMVGNWWDGVAVFDKMLKYKPMQKAFGGAFKTMGEISNKISNNDWWKATGTILSEGGITSWPGEIASEASGNVITSILTLDSEPLKEFANPRFYGQIALQSSFMSGVNLVGKTIAGGVGAGVDAYQTNKKYNQTMQMLNESAPFKDEKLENIRQRLINAINDNQYTDENGEISNSGVTNAIAELNEYANTKAPTELTNEEIITIGLLNNAANYGIHKFGQDEAVKAYVQSQLGYEFANKDNYVYELDYDGKQYFILDTKGKAMVAVDRATGKKEVLPVEKVEAAKHSIKQTNASDWARNEFLMHVDQWRQQDKTSAVGTSAPVSNAPTDGNAQQANAQQVDNGGTPDSAVTINPEEAALFDAVIIDGVQYPIRSIDAESGQCTIVDQEGNERIVDINDDEVTPIQTKFEDKEAEGKIDVPKSQQQTQPQPQQPQTEQVNSESGEGELPLTKDGDIDFDALLDLSPERYAQEYVSALGGNVEEAVSDMTDELKRIDGEIKGLTTKRKSAKLANKPKISKQISDLKRKRQSIENVISLLSQKPVNEPVQPQGQQEGTKPFTAGQSIVDKWNGAKKVYGNEDTQIAPNGQVIHGRWVVTEADAATPSHDPFTYAPSEGFPKTKDGKNVNDNDYTNKVADVTTKSANFDGRAYENTPKVINGVVIDGNNRTMSRIQAAQQGTDTAYLETLRAKSASRGIPAQEYADMQNPTMYFEVTDQLPLTTETFAMFNARESKSKTPTERAIVASKRDYSRLIGNILSEISKYEKLSELYSNQNACAAIIRYMIEAGVINQNEVNELFENGSFTSNGKDFLESLLIGSVMKEDQIKELNTEGMKRFRERLIRCIIPLAENSKLKKENRILDDLNKAISYIRRAKVNNMSLRELFLQNDMFNPQTFDEGAVFVALKFMQSDAEFRDFVTMVNARLSTETPNIFTGELETKQDIYNESEQQLTDEERATLNAARETNRLNSQTETVPGDGINTEQGGPGVDADAKTEVQQVEEEVQEEEVEQQPETIEDKEAETPQQTEEKPTQPQEPQQPTAQIEEKKGSLKSTNPSGNRLVTDERYAELRERMRKKLGGQMNIGIDPEILAIGTEMAVYHLEKGARKFTDYAKAMIADLGDTIRPYLKSFYNGARNLPEVENSDIALDLTPYDEVQKYDVVNFDKQKDDSIEQSVNLDKKAETDSEVEIEENDTIGSIEQTSLEDTTEDLSVDLFNNEIYKDDGLQRNDDAVRTEGLSTDNNVDNRRRGEATNSEETQQDSERSVGDRDSGSRGVGESISQSDRGSAGRIERLDIPKNNRNNHSQRGEEHAPNSVEARIAANIEAIKLAKELIENGEQATESQMHTLRKFSGWGGLGRAFNEGTYYSPNNISKQLRELLGEEAYQEALMSANSAYYTPSYVIDTLWDIAERLGFKGGNILEGSAGIGNILGQMPTHISERSDIHAIEIDGTSGGILSLLYPDAKVEIQGFEQTYIANGSVDLAITNVPFVTGLRVNDTTGDKDLSKKFHNIHDFCIAKNVRKLREGGLGIFITSNGTLDNSKKLRDWITNEGGADFIGAFRMNNKTFVGTGVTSDIIVIRKRVNSTKSANAIDVSSVSGERTVEYNTGETRKVKGNIVPVVKQLSMDYNKYFIEHPERMAGEMKFAFEEGDTFRPTSKGLYPSQDKNQIQMLQEFVNTFTPDEFGEKVDNNVAVIDNNNGKKIGEVFVRAGKLYINNIGSAQPLEVNANKVKGHTKVECFNAYLSVKNALSAVLDYQTNNESNDGLQPLLDELNNAYDNFVKIYGNFNKNTAIAFLRNDVDYANVASVETYKEVGDGKGGVKILFGKSDVMKGRVIEKSKEPTPTNIKDGIIASIFKFGRVDVPYIAKHLGKSIEDIKNEIIESGLGFENPINKQIEVAYQYLSGNVREKIRQAQDNNVNGEYARNIKALQDVMPMDIPAHLIDFTLGSSWVDPKLYDKYVKERTDVDVEFTHVDGTWFMNEPYYVSYEKNRGFGVRSEMLGRNILGHTLIEAAIQNKSITVSTTRKNWDGSTETITDKEATQACAAKIDEIRQDFKDWARQKMQSDAEMSDKMGKIYNEKFNNYVPVSISDDFIPEYFGGASHKFQMKPHQARAIVRGTMQPLLLAHEVGTGKTFTLISTAMEMRRLGTAKKPMIVVQNATVGQFVASAKELYPNAKILTLEDADRNAEGRKQFYAKIRYNDWDMIIIPQSTFEFIPDSEERQIAYIQNKIDEKVAILERMKEVNPEGNSIITRQAEKEIDLLETQLAQLTEESSKKRTVANEKKRAVALQNTKVKAAEMLDRDTDDVENFDEMGIDALLIDEAHEYKHLGFATAMQRGVKGVDPSYSKKSQGVFLKTQAVLENNNGKNVIFATGTPISNTAAEIWTFMRYLMPADTMQDYGIYYFDDFVRNFGNIQQMLEFTTSGKFKENNRFAGYVNLPELVRIWSSVSDTVLTKEAGGVTEKIPELEQGKAQDIYLPQTRALRSIMKFVKAKLEEYDKMSGKQKKENSHIPLTMYGIAKAAAVDARLVQTDAEDDANSKTNEAVRQTLRSLNETSSYNGTIAIFADNYQNRESGFNLYEDIRAKLIKEGVPANEIIIIKSGMSIKKKLEIFEKVNRGEIRVILGSTFTLGTGVNIQQRLHTLIHLDAPNRPMDYTQRNGRILRQGNQHKEMNKPVRILRFGVEDSLDVTAYQRLKTKGAIADSIMNGKQMMKNSMINRVLEEDEDVFGDTVAQLSGSEYAMLKNNAEKNVRKYESRKKQYVADQTYIHNVKPKIKALINDAENRIEKNTRYLNDVRSSFPNGKFKSIIIGKNQFSSIEEMDDFFKEYNKKQLAELKQMKSDVVSDEQKRQLNIKIGDFSFVITSKLTRKTIQKQASLFSDVERRMVYSCEELGIEDVPVHQNLLRNAIEDITQNVITGKDIEERLEAAQRQKVHNESELEQLQSREGKPFEYEEELEKAKAQYIEYTELMKKEMEEKEAKYAEMDATVETADDLMSIEEDEEILYRSTNETDQELTEQSKGLSEEAAETQISELSDKMKTKVHYVRNEDITGNTPTDRKKRRSKGWYQNGEVYINLSSHETVQDAVETFLHETVAHKGLRALLGDKFEGVMKQVFNSLTDTQKQSLLEIFGSEVVSAEEFLASMAERDIEPSLVDKVLAIIREALREFEIISSFTNGDLQYLLWKSKNNLQEGATLAQEVRFKQKDAEVRYRTSTRPAGYSTNDIEMTVKDRLLHNIQDRMRPVKKIMEEVVRLGGVITENSDPHSQEFLSSSRAASEIESFRNERFKPMMDKVNELVKILMEKHSVDHKEAYDMVIDYLYAKHAPERNKYICVREMKEGALSALTTDDRLKMTDDMKAQFDTMAEQIYENMFTGGKHTVNIKGNNLSVEQEKILTKLALRLQARAKSISTSKEGNNRAGLTDAEAADIISRLYDSSTSTAFDQLQDLVKSCTRFTLDKWLEYGMISQADYDNYNNMFEYYIPLRSWEEKEDIPYDEINSRTFNMASELMSGNKQAKGRSSKAFDPLPYISSMATSACVSGNRNRVRQHAFNLVSNNMGRINHIGTIAKTYMVYDEDGNVMGITYKRPSQDLFDKGRVKVLKDNTYFWHKTGQQQKVHSVDVFFNGDRHTVIFKGEIGALAATAVNGTENTTRNLVVQTAAKLTRMISTNLTARNPIFLAKNLIRDLGFGNFAYFVENGWTDTVKLNKYFAQAMAVAARDARGKSNNSADDLLYQEFKANGGQTGYIELESINKIDKEIQKIVAKAQGNQGVVDKLSMPVTSLFDMFEVLGKASENAMRFAIYKLSREQGLSARASAIRAKEITVNFNRKGKNTQSFSASYAFFNPAVQGTYRFAKLAKENPRRFATAIGTLTALKFGFVMMARAFGGGGDDDELNAYDRISDYVKATNIIIPIGGEKFIAIPLPQSVRALTYIADCAADVIHGKKGFGEALGDFILFNVGEFLPLDIDSIDIDNPGKSTLKALTPTAVRPIIENIFNSDFMGNPIYKEPFILDEDGKPQYQMVFGTTSKVLVGGFELLNRLGGGDEFRSAGVKISRNGTIEPSWRTIFDWNPAKIEHVFKGYFGGMFDVFNDAVDTAFEIGDAFKGEGLDVDNIVLLKEFIIVPTSKPGYKTFYEMRDEVNDIKEQNRNYKEQYGNEYYAILKGSRFNYEITRYYDVYSRQIQSLNEMLMKVTDDKELYNEIESQRDALILEAARTYNEIKQRRDNEN